MNNDDDTQLSAYIDGQLDFKAQQKAEWALVASPRIAENVRALTAVRDLVAGLPRDTCADVSPRVMMRIGALTRSGSRLSRPRGWTARAWRPAIIAAGLTSAAGILLMVSVFLSFTRSHVGGPAAPPNDLGPVAAGSQAGPNVEPGGQVVFDLESSRPRPKIANVSSEKRDPRPRGAEHDRATAVAVDANAPPADLELARRMLDNPAQRRLFLIKSGADGKTRREVANVVERTSRSGYFKFTISQGIVIVPRYPDGATVFALLANSRDLDRLRDQLKDSVPGAIEERSADPDILTQLADIHQVQEVSPVAPAEVLTPREALAFRTRSGGVDHGGQSGAPAPEKALALPAPEQYRSAPVPVAGRSVPGPENADEKFLVLVWVSQ